MHVSFVVVVVVFCFVFFFNSDWFIALFTSALDGQSN